jgi:hypothetical protein
LVGFLPTALLVAFVLVLVGSGAPATSPSLQRLLDNLEELSARQLGAIALTVVTVTLLVHPLQISVVRLLEGYWDDWPLGRTLSAIGVNRHRRRRARLEDTAYDRPENAEQERHQRRASAHLRHYPAEARLLPTRLGNALRAAEDEAGPRYGLQTVATLPRLYPCMSDRFASMFADLRNQLDMSTRFCVTLLIATLISVSVLLPYPRWLAVPAVTAGLSWVSYRAAVRAAMSYGEGLRVAFDLYRFDLIEALHYPLPASEQEERSFNRRLSAFLAAGIPMHADYRHASGSAPARDEP